MYLLDTNTVSQVVKRVPNAAVMTKIGAQRPGRLFASEMTRFELRFGASLLPNAVAFWAKVEAEILPLVTWLPVIKPIAESAGEIAAALQKAGRAPKDPIDPLIAATASVHGMILVTHNVRDFAHIPDLEIEDWFV